jgi:SPP1 gp7 family putative phage head morphogenesis protein
MARKDWKRPPGRIEIQYREEIDRLLETYFDLPSAPTLGELTSRLVEWSQIDRVFLRYAEKVASSMITGVATHDFKNWRDAATHAMKGPRIYDLLRRDISGSVGATIRRQVRTNAELITSLPSKVAKETQDFIADQQQQGVRSTTIMRELRKRIPTASKAKIELLARTGVSSSETAVTRARAEDLSLDWYEWVTAGGIRVRPSHRIMNKVLVRWAEPPSPELLLGIKSSLGHYNAGNCPNCRCVALPLVQSDEVQWPHKVYISGRITLMTRPQFLRVAPGYRIAA